MSHMPQMACKSNLFYPLERGELPHTFSLHIFCIRGNKTKFRSTRRVAEAGGTCSSGRRNVFLRPPERVPIARESRKTDRGDASRQETLCFHTFSIKHFEATRHPHRTKKPLDKGPEDAFFEGVRYAWSSVNLPIYGHAAANEFCTRIIRPPDDRQPPASHSCRWGRPLRPKCPWARRASTAVSSCPSSAHSP